MKTLFESEAIKVYMNPSGDVFHLNKSTNVVIRIIESDTYTRITADSCSWQPHSYNGLPAMLIKPFK